MTYDAAKAWAENLVFAGYDDWRLPSAIDFVNGLPDIEWDSTNNEFGYLYVVEWANPWGKAWGYSLPPHMATMPTYWDTRPLDYWLGTEDDSDSIKAYTFFTSWDGLWLVNDPPTPKEQLCRVTAVRGLPNPTPVPSPVAEFTATPSLILYSGQTATFDPSVSHDTGGTITGYSWVGEDESGHLNSKFLANPTPFTITWTTEGVYNVKLTVTDDSNLQGIASHNVTVSGIQWWLIVSGIISACLTIAVGYLYYRKFILRR
jgi:hypothetical protein